MLGFENAGGPQQNAYARTAPGRDVDGYLQPHGATVAAPAAQQKKPSLLARLSLVSTTSGTEVQENAMPWQLQNIFFPKRDAAKELLLRSNSRAQTPPIQIEFHLAGHSGAANSFFLDNSKKSVVLELVSQLI